MTPLARPSTPLHFISLLLFFLLSFSSLLCRLSSPIGPHSRLLSRLDQWQAMYLLGCLSAVGGVHVEPCDTSRRSTLLWLLFLLPCPPNSSNNSVWNMSSRRYRFSVSRHASVWTCIFASGDSCIPRASALCAVFLVSKWTWPGHAIAHPPRHLPCSSVGGAASDSGPVCSLRLLPLHSVFAMRRTNFRSETMPRTRGHRMLPWVGNFFARKCWCSGGLLYGQLGFPLKEIEACDRGLL